MSTGLIILAAGESARLGEPKQLLIFEGKTLLQQAIDTALSLETGPVVVVLGANVANIRKSLGKSSILIAENAEWHRGMGGSLRLGLKTLLEAEPNTVAAIFLVCDQPLLVENTLRLLLDAHASGAAIAAAEYNNSFGVPALFERRFFPELLALSGADGARKIIQRHLDEVIGVPFPEGACDIDTPDDLLRFQLRAFSP